jgi:HNH endonuclease
MKIDLQEGNVYPYSDLKHARDGGSGQFYLPFKGQQVFAALLTPEKNPDASNVVLVGSNPRVVMAGAIFSRQQTPVPTFIKKATNQWTYAGMYRVSEVVEQSSTVTLADKARRSDVVFALRLEKIDGRPSGGSEDRGSSSQLTYMEGACGQLTKNLYERDQAARNACLQHYGLQCNVCRIAFGDEYQDRGTSFIHVHYLEPLAARGGPTVTDPLRDLVPVCPNCHAMLHAAGGLMTPAELRTIYWSEASTQARLTRLNAKPCVDPVIGSEPTAAR